MTEIELARKCGQSFALGMAFMYGYLHLNFACIYTTMHAH